MTDTPAVTDPAAIVRRMTDHRREIYAACRRLGFRDPTVFGSMLTGAYTETSDVDLAVTTNRPASCGLSVIGRCMRLHEELTVLLRIGRELDVVEVSLLKPEIAEAVLRDGRPL